MPTASEREAFYTVVRSRRSVREYLDRDVPDDVLERVLETGRRAASAANRQPWWFVVARRRDRDPLYRLVAGRSMERAPVLLAGIADRSRAWARRGDGVGYGWVDVTIALTEMILAATAEGLGTCWIAAFDAAEARRILRLPDTADPVSLVSIGWPEEPLVPVDKDRRPLDEVVRRGSPEP